jgi:hypothetical protein
MAFTGSSVFQSRLVLLRRTGATAGAGHSFTCSIAGYQLPHRIRLTKPVSCPRMYCFADAVSRN